MLAVVVAVVVVVVASEKEMKRWEDTVKELVTPLLVIHWTVAVLSSWYVWRLQCLVVSRRFTENPISETRSPSKILQL
jgi:hypothetical protein